MSTRALPAYSHSQGRRGNPTPLHIVLCPGRYMYHTLSQRSPCLLIFVGCRLVGHIYTQRANTTQLSLRLRSTWGNSAGQTQSRPYGMLSAQQQQLWTPGSPFLLLIISYGIIGQHAMISVRHITELEARLPGRVHLRTREAVVDDGPQPTSHASPKAEVDRAS